MSFLGVIFDDWRILVIFTISRFFIIRIWFLVSKLVSFGGKAFLCVRGGFLVIGFIFLAFMLRVVFRWIQCWPVFFIIKAFGAFLVFMTSIFIEVSVVGQYINSI